MTDSAAYRVSRWVDIILLRTRHSISHTSIRHNARIPWNYSEHSD